MSMQKGPQQISFQGKIIEIVEQKRETSIKVSLFPCSIEIPIYAHERPRLGDLISFDATIKVRNVEKVVPTD